VRTNVSFRSAIFAAWLAWSGLGCAKVIGDECRLSTDCSTRQDRVCDTSQPGGYCTQLGCRPNACPDDAVCVLFGAAVPGCQIDERELSRSARSLCAQECENDGDCRDGRYVCARERTAPWNARILDDDRGRGFCVPRPTSTPLASPPAPPPVCQAPSPPSLDGGAADAGAGGDASADASHDAAVADGGTPDAGR
jgi:hypothetical protein